MLPWRPLVVSAFVVLGALIARPSEPVEHNPPPVYAESIAPLLTPIDDVLPGRTAFEETEKDGVVLLAEVVHFRAADGLLYRVYHHIYHAVGQSAVEALGNNLYSFDRERESIFLVDAATVLPDGTRMPVAEKGAFIQTPQHEAENNLYTSQAELNVIFPQVAAGATTEAIVLIRENTPLMPGEFSTYSTFGAGWATYRRNLVVDLPDTDWARMNIKTTSSTIATPASTQPGPGRTRKTWSAAKTPRGRWEEAAPDSRFCKPTVWLTTLDNWDRVAAWFHGLAAARSDLGDELAAEVGRLTDGIESTDKIVEVLQSAVSDQVRYTGLEFGLAGYQPYPCADVWKRRYGDCKDKANLLRAMLATKGIASHLVLLNTGTLGRIERDCPNWSQFNHVILAVENGSGSYLFCDPTIEHLPPGGLGFGDSDRDVLVVNDGRAEWMRTPAQSGAAIRIAADLALAADSEISGWFTLSAEGSDAAHYADLFNRQDHDDLQRYMQRLTEGFIPGSEVVDVEYRPLTGPTRNCAIRAFLRRPPRADNGDSMIFPFPASWLPDVSTIGERVTPYGTVPREESLVAKIALPPGWVPRQLPAEFNAPSAAAAMSAAWSFADGVLQARLNWQPAKGELTPAEYPVFQRSVRALTAWIAQPITFDLTGTTAQSAGATAAPELANFPLLPTGEGQLRLLDEKYPPGKNDAARRAALERVLQWFPHDAETTFTAQVHLIRLDREKEGATTFADRLAQLLAKQGAKVSSIARSWAEYLEIQARWETGKTPDLVGRMRGLADDESLTLFRRGWAAYETGRYLLHSDPAAALKFLRPFCAFASEARADTIALAGAACAEAGEIETLGQLLRDHPEVPGTGPDALLLGLLDSIQSSWSAISASDREKCLTLFARTIGTADVHPKARERFDRMRATDTAARARSRFAAELSKWLAANPPAWWTREKDTKFADAAALVEHIKARNSAHDADAVIDAALQLVIHHDPSFEDFAQYTRWALWWMNNKGRDEALFAEIARLSLDLPPAASSEVASIWTTAAEHRAAQGDLAGARELYNHAFDTPGVQDYQRVNAAAALAEMERKRGNIDAALAAFWRLERIHTSHTNGADYLFTALVLEVERGAFDRAAQLVESMGKHEQQYLDKTANAPQITALLRSRPNLDALKTYWAKAAAWRTAWRTFLASAGGAPMEPKDLPPSVSWDQENHEFDQAVAASDRATCLRLLDREAMLARSVPLVGANFIGHAVKLGFFPADQFRRLQECALTLVADPQPVDPTFDDTALLWEAAMLADTGKKDAAAAKARDLYTRAGSTPVGQGGLRVWLMSATAEPDRRAAADAAFELLASDATLHDRTLTVGTLSDLLLALRDTAPHLALLDRETTRQDFDPNSHVGRILVSRLAQLRTEGASAQAFTTVVRNWTELPGHEWLSRVHPLVRTEPRFAALRGPLTEATNGFTETERLKYNLLIALDEDTVQPERESAFCEVVYRLALGTNDIVEFTNLMLTAASDEAISENNRGYLLRLAVWHTSDRLRPDLLAKCRAHRLFAKQVETYRQSVEALGNAIELRSGDSADRRQKAFAALLARPLDSLRLGQTIDTLQALVFAGQAEVAESLVTGTTEFAVDPALNQSPAAVRLKWRRGIRLAGEAAPLVTKLREIFLEFAETRRAPGRRALNLIDLWEHNALTLDEEVALGAHLLRRGEGLGNELHAILSMLRGIQTRAPDRTGIGLEAFNLLVDLPMSDPLKSSLLVPVAILSDSDDPEVRRIYLEALPKLTTPSAVDESPQTATSAAFFRAIIALRSDRAERPPALFDVEQAKLIPKDFLHQLQLQFFASRGRYAQVRSMLDEIDPALVANEGLLGSVRPALMQPEYKDERSLFEEASMNALARRIDEAWAAPQGRSSWTRIEQVLTVECMQGAVPPELISFLASSTRNELTRAKIELSAARMRHDPPATKQAADALLRLVPRMYETYLDRAEAHRSLGDNDAARADLDVFLHYCLDHQRYPEALAIRRALDGVPARERR